MRISDDSPARFSLLGFNLHGVNLFLELLFLLFLELSFFLALLGKIGFVCLLSRFEDVLLEFRFNLVLEFLDLSFVFSLSLVQQTLEEAFLEVLCGGESVLVCELSVEESLGISNVLCEFVFGFLSCDCCDLFLLGLAGFSFNIVHFSESFFVLVFLLFLECILDVLAQFNECFDLDRTEIFFSHVFNLDTFDFSDLITLDLNDFLSDVHLLLEQLSFNSFSELLFFEFSIVFFHLAETFTFFEELVFMFSLIDFLII